MVVSHNELRVHQDVARKDQRTDDAIAKFDLAVVREEHGHEPEQDQHPQRAEQVWHPVREVVFALACEQAQCNKDSECENDRFEHNLRVREGDHDRDSVRFHRRESREESQIGWIRLALPEGETEEDECADDRHPQRPLVCLDPLLVRFRCHRDTAQSRRREELHRPKQELATPYVCYIYKGW